MSSATSIDSAELPAKPEANAEPVDNGFKAWHFFVLASLMAATVAVVMSRRSTPEHLVLISATIAAAGLAAAGMYRMLAPLATADPSAFREAPSERMRATLQRDKALTLRSIKELEFDRAMGKVSEKDFDEMSGRLRARAISLMKQLAEGETGYREIVERDLRARLAARDRGARPAEPPPQLAPEAAPAAIPTCASCGTANDADAAFCKRCGARLGAPGATA
jgi:hypothetical protein